MFRLRRGCVKMWMRMGDVLQKYVFSVKELEVWVVSGFQLLSKFWDIYPSKWGDFSFSSSRVGCVGFVSRLSGALKNPGEFGISSGPAADLHLARRDG
jgi:hypothetical protein